MRITNKMVSEIQARVRAGEKQTRIADDMGLSINTVNKYSTALNLELTRRREKARNERIKDDPERLARRREISRIYSANCRATRDRKTGETK